MQSLLDTTGSDSDRTRALVDALKRFCRSIELCDKYFRGYYGLKTVTRPSSSKSWQMNINKISGNQQTLDCLD